MRRRDFIAGLMIAAVTARAQAQQTGKVYRIAFAYATAPLTDIHQASQGSFVIPAIFEELIRLGYHEGRNLLIERYSGEGRALHYPDLWEDVGGFVTRIVFAVAPGMEDRRRGPLRSCRHPRVTQTLDMQPSTGQKA